MPNIIGIETTGQYTSVALFNEHEVLLTKENNTAFSSSGYLHSLIEELFYESAIELKEIDAIALSSGPGSYTGLRIGSSTAKGLCTALGVPLIAIPTHEAMTYDEQVKAVEVACLTDARRDDVFLSVYSMNKMVLGVKVCDITAPEFENLLTNRFIVGSGTAKVITQFPEIDAFTEADCLHAKNLHLPSIVRFNSQDFNDIYTFEPAYEKEFYTTAKVL